MHIDRFNTQSFVSGTSLFTFEQTVGTFWWTWSKMDIMSSYFSLIEVSNIRSPLPLIGAVLPCQNPKWPHRQLRMQSQCSLYGQSTWTTFAGIPPAGHLDQVGMGLGIQILGMRQYCWNVWNAETYSPNNSSFSEGKLGLSRGNGNQAASTLQGRLWV